MKINSKSWHYKLYEFSCALQPTTQRVHIVKNQEMIDICRYIRQIVIMLPLKIATYIALIVAMVFFIQFAAPRVNFESLSIFTGAIMVITAVVCWVIWKDPIKRFFNSVFKRNHERPIYDEWEKNPDTSFQKLYKKYKETADQYCDYVEIEK